MSFVDDMAQARDALYRYGQHPDALALWLWCRREWFTQLDPVIKRHLVTDPMGKVGHVWMRADGELHTLIIPVQQMRLLLAWAMRTAPTASIPGWNARLTDTHVSVEVEHSVRISSLPAIRIWAEGPGLRVCPAWHINGYGRYGILRDMDEGWWFEWEPLGPFLEWLIDITGGTTVLDEPPGRDDQTPAWVHQADAWWMQWVDRLHGEEVAA